MAHSSHWSPPQVTLADDRGTSASAHLSGGGSDDEWRGKFTADTPLARDTRWIEIDGLRIGLDREPPAIEVAVQELPAQDPAMSYLWRQLADSESFHGRRNTSPPRSTRLPLRARWIPPPQSSPTWERCAPHSVTARRRIAGFARCHNHGDHC